MTSPHYKIFSLLILLIISAFPCYQIFVGSPLWYTNGWDEASYLQYDYAKHILEISGPGRMAEWVVVWLHDLGFSGGKINFLFDITTTLIILFLGPRLLVLAGLTIEQSRINTVIILGIPIFFSNANPAIELLQSANTNSNLIKYFSAPFINDPLWLRTPEPQLSIITLMILSYLSIKTQKGYLLLLITPFLYPFISIPVAFILVATLISKLRPSFTNLAALSSAILISLSLFFYRQFLIPYDVTGYIIPTHLPLVGLCAVTAAILFLLSKNRSPLLLLLFISTWLVLNFQILSGFTIQPNNFEQYWSIVAVALIVTLGFQTQKAFPIISILLIFYWGFLNFRQNQNLTQKVELTDAILEEIKLNSAAVAVNDIYVSTRLDMLYPKQKPLLFSYTRFYKKLPDKMLQDFICAKDSLKSDPEFVNIVDQASDFYLNGDQNYILNTIGRTEHPLPKRNLEQAIPACTVKKVRIK